VPSGVLIQKRYSSGAVPPVAVAVHVIVVPAAVGSGTLDARPVTEMGLAMTANVDCLMTS